MEQKEEKEEDVSDDSYIDDYISEMLDVAEQLLTASGRELLVGVCTMHHLSCLSGLRDESPFDDFFFAGIESDCHELPIYDDFRLLCSPGHLERCESRINHLADLVQVELQRKCRELLARFEPENPLWREDESSSELNDKSQ